MKNILCFGDSNTYGLNPEWVKGNFGRHPKNVRWPGKLQEILGSEYYIIEEGLSGRTTVFDDPTMPNRNGSAYLVPCIESHTPLDLIIFMLGTNDTKPLYSARTVEIAQGMSRLVRMAKDPGLYMGMPVPKILVAAPVPLNETALTLPDHITTPEMIKKSEELAADYETMCRMYGAEFIDLKLYAKTSNLDGVHLLPEAHEAVAKAFAAKVKEMLR